LLHKYFFSVLFISEILVWNLTKYFFGDLKKKTVYKKYYFCAFHYRFVEFEIVFIDFRNGLKIIKNSLLYFLCQLLAEEFLNHSVSKKVFRLFVINLYEVFFKNYNGKKNLIPFQKVSHIIIYIFFSIKKLRIKKNRCPSKL